LIGLPKMKAMGAEIDRLLAAPQIVRRSAPSV